MTQQRRAILAAVCDAGSHRTAEQIYQRVKAQIPSLSRGTVYRNLNVLTEEGKILRVRIPGEPDRYDKTVKMHDHCVCVRCGKMFDLPENGLRSALEDVLARPVCSYELTVRTLCDECRKSSGENPKNPEEY